MTYAKNSLGRSTGRKFNMASMKREMAKKLAKAFDEAAFEKARKLRDAQPQVINFGGIQMIPVDKLDSVELCPDCNHPYLIEFEDHSPCEYCCNEVRAGKRHLEDVCEHYAGDTPEKYLSRNYY